MRCWTHRFQNPSINNPRINQRTSQPKGPRQLSQYSDYTSRWTICESGFTSQQRKEISSLRQRLDWLWGSPTVPSNGYRGVLLFPRGKGPRHEPGHSSKSRSEVRNALTCNSTPQQVIMACCYINHRETSTFPYNYSLSRWFTMHGVPNEDRPHLSSERRPRRRSRRKKNFGQNSRRDLKPRVTVLVRISSNLTDRPTDAVSSSE
jgi:hypothetical protein